MIIYTVFNFSFCFKFMYISFTNSYMQQRIIYFQAFSSLAESAYEAADATEEDPETYCMSSVYEKVVEKLLQTTDRFILVMSLHFFLQS